MEFELTRLGQWLVSGLPSPVIRCAAMPKGHGFSAPRELYGSGIMNNAALAIADRELSKFPTITLKKGESLYHGARSKEKILGLRPNAMFTSNLCYAVDYAFGRDLRKFNEDGTISWRNDLFRALFCCVLEEDIEIIKITGVDWPALCMEIQKADDSMPAFDGWLQEKLTAYLARRYGKQIKGAILLSGTKNSLDEYIFSDANSIFSVQRRID